MDLRNFNYKLPQLLTRLRALFRRDQDWINVAFQRSVILTRRDQPRQFALSRIDFFRHTDKIPDESESRYKQIRFIAERLSPPRIIARLNRLGDLKFTAAKSNFVLNQTPGFSDDYRPRDNEYSNWPGTYFDISVESSIYLSQDTLVDPVLPIYDSEYEATAAFLELQNLSAHDGRLGHIALFVPNFNGRIENLTLSGQALSIELSMSREFSDELILDIDYSTGERAKKISISVTALIHLVNLEFEPTKLNIWLKSRRGYILDYHKETPVWSVGVPRILPESLQRKAYGGVSPLDDVTVSDPVFDTSGKVILAADDELPSPDDQRRYPAEVGVFITRQLIPLRITAVRRSASSSDAAARYEYLVEDLNTSARVHVCVRVSKVDERRLTTHMHNFYSLSVNCIRKAVDEGVVQWLTSTSECFVLELSEVDFPALHPSNLRDFLIAHVYWLGFRTNPDPSRYFVPLDRPVDLSYLGISKSEILRASWLLQQDELIRSEDTPSTVRPMMKLISIFQSAPHLQDGAKHGVVQRGNDGGMRPMFSREGGIQMSVSIQETEGSPGFDVFISHASEDKDYVGPLVAALESADIEVWFDEVNLAWGDDLRSAIDRGLAACRYGIVVFSKAFLAKKKWTEYELNALFALETPGQKRILPIWHNVNRDDLVRYSPAFADRIAKISATHSYPDIVKSLRAMLGRSASSTGEIQPSGTPAAVKPSVPRPNPIAYAWYETQGESALKAQSYVRESPANRGRFTYDNSFGHEQLGTKEEIAMLFAGFDKSLTVKGYIRKHWANLSGDPIFNL